MKKLVKVPRTFHIETKTSEVLIEIFYLVVFFS